jgi:hypothetical protein
MNKNQKNENNVKKNTKDEKQSKGKEVKESSKRNEKSVVQKETKSKDQPISTVKRPSNSYMFFSRDKNRREEISSKYNLKGKELASKMGEVWKTMTEEQKKPYVDMQLNDKARYEREILMEEKKDSKSIKKSSNNTEESENEGKKKKKNTRKKKDEEDDDEDE